MICVQWYNIQKCVGNDFYCFFVLFLLQVCYFVNSGIEVNDMVIMMVRVYIGNFDIVFFRLDIL